MSIIVVGVDGSEQALGALRWASAEAVRRQAQVRVVGVFDYAVVDVLGANVQLHPFTGDPSKAFEHVVAAVDAVKGEYPDLTYEPEAIEGDPGRVLCEVAKEAELVVLGRHGARPGPHRLGTVASYVTHHCPCPVAIVPGAV